MANKYKDFRADHALAILAVRGDMGRPECLQVSTLTLPLIKIICKHRTCAFCKKDSRNEFRRCSFGLIRVPLGIDAAVCFQIFTESAEGLFVNPFPASVPFIYSLGSLI